MATSELQNAVDEWLRLDKDPETLSEIKTLVTSQDYTELHNRLSTRITFGTAGLRARMQAGNAYMNSLTVIQATQGLTQYALKVQGEKVKEMGAVIGHDHRFRSKRFAELAAGVFRSAGVKVYLLEGLSHTPMIPFSVSHLGAAVGIQITASHNPAADNGYKVYWSNAVQIIPPHDHGIAAEIDRNLEVGDEAWMINDEAIHEFKGTKEMKELYFEASLQLCSSPKLNASTPLLFTYTAMHGVGLPYVQKIFEAYGFKETPLQIVVEQAEPDPTFPTVKFPNPEEKGALDLAIAHADRVGSTIVLANDPDADRFCAAEKSNGQWNVFTGDQLGTLLGSWVLKKYKDSGKPLENLAMCASTVSSKMLRTMAKQEGFVFRETLTGFKYLGNEALELAKEGKDAVFAYEEAIGYMLGSTIRDKDGVTALASFCELAVYLDHQEEKMSVTQYLDGLYEQYGYFKTSNSYFVCRDQVKIDRIFWELRFGDQPINTASPTLHLPKTLATYPLTSLRDLTFGYDSSNPPSFKPTLPVDPKSHMISFSLGSTIDEKGDGVEVVGTVRTSGTEPKIKFYLEASGKDRKLVCEKLERVREAIGVEWLRWEEFGLERA